MRSRNRSGTSFGVACALAALVVFGALFDAFHRAEVQHRVCAEHGELVHVGANACAPARCDATSGAEHASPGFEGVDPAHDPHEHCGLGTFTRPTAVVWAPLTFARASYAEIPTPPIARESRAGEPIARLRLAPKHSPPRISVRDRA